MVGWGWDDGIGRWRGYITRYELFWCLAWILGVCFRISWCWQRGTWKCTQKSKIKSPKSNYISCPKIPPSPCPSPIYFLCFLDFFGSLQPFHRVFPPQAPWSRWFWMWPWRTPVVTAARFIQEEPRPLVGLVNCGGALPALAVGAGTHGGGKGVVWGDPTEGRGGWDVVGGWGGGVGGEILGVRKCSVHFFGARIRDGGVSRGATSGYQHLGGAVLLIGCCKWTHQLYLLNIWAIFIPTYGG